MFKTCGIALTQYILSSLPWKIAPHRFCSSLVIKALILAWDKEFHKRRLVLYDKTTRDGGNESYIFIIIAVVYPSRASRLHDAY
jgi:hypothetical protein